MDRPRHPLVIRPWNAGHTRRGKANTQSRKTGGWPVPHGSRKSLIPPSPRKGRSSS